MDVTNDTSRRMLIMLHNKYRFPDYVQNAEPLSKEAAAQLPDNLFADVSNRQFPYNDEANTWLSAAYFHETKDDVKLACDRQIIKETLLKVAEVYGVYYDVAAIFDQQPEVEKEAEVVEAEYCYADEGVYAYPIRKAEDVKLAENYFMTYRHRYTPEVRKTVASNLLKRAGTFHVIIEEPVLYKEAGHALPDMPGIMRTMTDAMLFMSDPEEQEMTGNLLHKIASAGMAQVQQVLPELIKVAEQAIGSSEGYTPEEQMYGTPFAAVEATVKYATTLDKYTFDARKLAQLSPEIFKQALPEDVVDELCNYKGNLDAEKVADVLPTLPRPDQILLERAITQACQ